MIWKVTIPTAMQGAMMTVIKPNDAVIGKEFI